MTFACANCTLSVLTVASSATVSPGPPVKKLSRSLIIGILALVPGVSSLAAQTTVANTFGPGDSHDDLSYTVSSFQSIAQGFVYGGSDGYFLSQVRLALSASGSPYTISFLTGADMNTATLLESWSATSSDEIVTLSSVLNPTLANGATYWLAAFNSSSSGGWYLNDQDYKGLMFKQVGTEWLDCPSCESSAYDVSVSAAPEPASIALLATGLVVVLGVTRRRERAFET